MPGGIEIKVSGLKEINKALHQLPIKLGKKVVVSALREGAKIIQKEARSLAPRRTGRLRRAIKVKRSKIHTKPRLGKFGFYIKINPGKKRNDRQGAYYGKFVDGGLKKRKLRAREFMLKAYNSKHKVAAKFTIKAAERGVDVVKKTLGL